MLHRFTRALLYTALLGLSWTGSQVLAVGELLTPYAKAGERITFDLPDLENRQHRSVDYEGRWLVVNFWATWCGPCRAEMPALGRAAQALAPDDIVVLGINVGDNRHDIDRFIADVPIPFPSLQDDDQATVRRMPVIGLPTTLIVNPEGRITHRITGEREWDHPELLAQIRALKEPPN
ncbi:MAG: TlpA disulfide reductase family protein [Pseudomonadota bacterium]